MYCFALIITVAFSCLEMTIARPNGAPMSACVSMTPRHGFNRASGRPYTVDTVGHGRIYVPGVPLRVRVTGPSYQGVLLQARKTDGSTTPQGTWTSVSSNFKTMFCSSSSDTVTHSNSAMKGNPEFQWTPPANTGPIKFIATVARQQLEWYSRIESPAISPDHCGSSPCMNGGSCSNSGTSFTCSCDSRWMGDRCQTLRSLTPGPVSGQTVNCPTDLVFVLDTSDGAMNANANQYLINFVKSVSSRLSSASNVGVISYGSNAEKTVDWIKPAEMQNRQLNFRRLSATNTNLGLDMARRDFFSNNPNSNQMVILISEGPRAGGKLQSYRQACTALKNAGVRVMVIGVLINNIPTEAFSELNCHHDQSYMHDVRDYASLRNKESDAINIMRGMCGTVTTDACTNQPCMNGGTCLVEGNNFRCVCMSGYTGTTCSNRDACFSNPCQNGAACFRNGNSFTCNCLNGWTGQTCAQRIPGDPCAPNPCRNSGFCNRNGNNYQCSCRNGYSGFNCEQPPVDPCNSNPCRNGGFCTRNGNSYQCSCRNGFSGLNCDQSADPCSSGPCVNGQCVRTGGTYRCDCFSGWTGNRCNSPVVSVCGQNIALDLVFLVDTSGSIQARNPQDGSWNYWQLMSQFMKEVTNRFPQDSLNVAVVEFGREAKLITPLTSPANARAAIDRMVYTGSVSNLASGLEMVATNVLTSSSNRNNAYDVVVILTDGVATVDVNNVLPYANAVRTLGPTGAKLVTVAIGGSPNANNQVYLDAGIVDQLNELLFLRDYVSLQNDVSATTQPICRYLLECVTPNGCPGIFTPPPENMCQPNPCMNGGTCMPSGNSYTCRCTSMYTGLRCDRMTQQETDVNEVFLARFESDDRFGDMTNENNGRDTLDWRTTNGRMKPRMGPMKDASEDNSRGNYAYIMYDRNTDFLGKTARYMTQPIQQTGAMCMEFKFWMTGGWDKLRVLVKRTNGQIIGVGEFKGTSDLNMWVRGQVNIEESSPGSVVIFEAHPYLDYSTGTNMIALDDVKVLDGGYCAPKPAVEGYYYRVVGGPTPFEGRVEVSRYNTTDSSMWGGLCMNGFGTLEAQLLCQKLFPNSEQILGFRPGRTISLPDYGNPMRMVQDNINCMNKMSIDDCMTSGWMETSCTLSESAKVRCDQPEFYYVGNEIRLADYVLDENLKTFSGRVELYYNGEWGTVCSRGFDQVDAQAVCNTIGFTGQARANLNAANGQGTGKVFLENVNCPMNAVEFTQCLQGQTWSSSCGHSQDAGVTCQFEAKNIEWNCNFENNNNCGFTPYSMNSFEWMTGRPTMGSPRGSSSMYTSVSASAGSNVMSANDMYEYSSWITPMFEAFPTTDFLCVRFWYNPYDIRDVQGSDSVFTVYMKMGRNSYPKFWLDSRDIGNANRRWTEAYFTISDASAPFKLKFVAKKLVPAGRQSYIMVDDIRVTEGSCTGEGYIMGGVSGGGGGGMGTPSPPTGSPSTVNCAAVNIKAATNFIFDCNFENNDPACSNSLQNPNGGNYEDWSRQTAGTPSSETGPTGGRGGGGYVFLEASNINTGDTAVARVTNQISGSMNYCLAFDYHMYGQEIGKLRIGHSTQANYDGNSVTVYELEGEKGQSWNMEQVDVMGTTLGTGYLYLLGIRGNGYRGDVSLDNVNLRQGRCCPDVCAVNLRGNSEPNIYNCDFQGQGHSGCCFRNCPDGAQSASGCDNFEYTQWVRTEGFTERLDRTRHPGNRGEFYLAVHEGNRNSRNTDQARLVTGMIELGGGSGGSICLRLKTYFTDNQGNIRVGILNSIQQTINPSNIGAWSDRSYTLTGLGKVQVSITGTQGSTGSVYIDNINLSNGRCT